MYKYKLHLIAIISISSVFIIGIITNQYSKAQELDAITNKVESLTSEDVQFDSNMILVKYKNDNSRSDNKRIGNFNIVSLDESTNQTSKNELTSINVASTKSEKDTIKNALKEYLQDPNVEHAQPNYIYETTTWTGSPAVPDDYDASEHWYYEQANVPEMWEDQSCDGGAGCGGSSDVTVAVIDTGLAYGVYDDTTEGGTTTSFTKTTTESFSGPDDFYSTPQTNGKNFTATASDYNAISPNFNIYTNSSETPNNGLDDDCNGYIDDYYGIDTWAKLIYDLNYGGRDNLFDTCTNGTPIDFSSDNDKFFRKMGHPVDSDGHGSYVTGFIAGEVDNNAASVSPAFQVTIMPIAANVTFLGSLPTYSIIDGIYYATNNGADVINMSLGGGPYDQAFEDAINYAYENGVVVIAASGNDSQSLDMQPVSYPAAYENVIAVGSVDSDNSRSYYSNGDSNLDLVAYTGSSQSSGNGPYQETITCYPNCDETSTIGSTGMKYSIGTSFASPQVAAAAAIIRSQYPNATPYEVKQILVDSTIDINTPDYDTQTGHGVLNWGLLNDNFTDTNLDTEYYFPWYDDSNNGSYREAWTVVANQSQIFDAEIEIYFKGLLRLSTTLQPGERITPQFAEERGGPVIVRSTNGTPIYTSQRVQFKNSFNEFPGISSNGLDTVMYYPWYDDSDLGGTIREAWLLVGNPSADTSANVTIEIDGNIIFNNSIAPGESVFPQWPEQRGGPVIITSDIPVYSTQRVQFKNTFNEYKGINENETDSTFYYPWYDDSDLGGTFREAWLLVGNPSADTSTNVTIEIDGNIIFNNSIAPGESVFPQWPEQRGGPIIVTSDIPVFSTQRVKFKNSFNEVTGTPNADLSTRKYFTWYDDSKSGAYREAWVVISNPSDTNTANVNINIQGKDIYTGSIPPGSSVKPQWAEQKGGPVIVSSDIPIFSSQRVQFKDSFNEMMGL